MKLPLKNKVILVVGGGGFLGRALSLEIARSGGRVAIADYDMASARDVHHELLEHGIPRRDLIAIPINMAHPASVARALSRVTSSIGHIDGIVNCAYPRHHSCSGDPLDIAWRDFCDGIRMHLGGYFLLCQHMVKYFMSRGGGVIVNIASIYGCMQPRAELYTGTDTGVPFDYAASKAGIIQFSRQLAKHCRNHSIRINCISPGGLLNSQPKRFQTAYRRHCCSIGLLSRSDISAMAVFLLSNDSRAVTGQNIIIDDGFSL